MLYDLWTLALHWGWLTHVARGLRSLPRCATQGSTKNTSAHRRTPVKARGGGRNAVALLVTDLPPPSRRHTAHIWKGGEAKRARATMAGVGRTTPRSGPGAALTGGLAQDPCRQYRRSGGDAADLAVQSYDQNRNDQRIRLRGARIFKPRYALFEEAGGSTLCASPAPDEDSTDGRLPQRLRAKRSAPRSWRTFTSTTSAAIEAGRGGRGVPAHTIRAISAVYGAGYAMWCRPRAIMASSAAPSASGSMPARWERELPGKIWRALPPTRWVEKQRAQPTPAFSMIWISVNTRSR